MTPTIWFIAASALDPLAMIVTCDPPAAGVIPTVKTFFFETRKYTRPAMSRMMPIRVIRISITNPAIIRMAMINALKSRDPSAARL